MRVKPKKSLGQHFLTDRNIAVKITGALTAEGYDRVVEVGPGMGILTELLIENRNFHTSVVEIDAESVNYLEKRFNNNQLTIIRDDFLQFRLENISPGQIAVIGNFPYNISSQIFFKILKQRSVVPEVVCMVQKEVARRIASPPGSRVYGILSVLLQAFYKTELLFDVGPNVFYPPPKVNSAVLRLRRRDNFSLECDEELFFRVVKTAFNQRRKMLRNSLRSFWSEKNRSDSDCYTPASDLLDKRAEQLSTADFVRLVNMVEKCIKRCG